MAVTEFPPFYNMAFTVHDGRLTPQSHLYLDQTYQSLREVQEQFNTAMNTPNKTTAEITAAEPDVPVGTVWFNTSLAKLVVKTASGTIETITST